MTGSSFAVVIADSRSLNHYGNFSLLIPKSAKDKIHRKSQILFSKILQNKWYHAKVLLKRFHLNGHTIGFYQQTQNLVLQNMSP